MTKCCIREGELRGAQGGDRSRFAIGHRLDGDLG